MGDNVAGSEVKDGTWILNLSSEFGEELSLPEIPTGISRVSINMEQVHHLNSSSIQQWFIWTKKLEQMKSPKGDPVEIHLNHLTTVFLRLIDLVYQILPKKAKIESFYITCSCLDCHEVTHKLVMNTKPVLDKEELLTSLETPPCTRCGFETELDLSARFYGELVKYSPL